MLQLPVEFIFDMALGTHHPLQGAFSPVKPETWKDASFPLGAHLLADTTTFAVYSKNAMRVLLEIYRAPIGRGGSFRILAGAWRGQCLARPTRESAPRNALCVSMLGAELAALAGMAARKQRQWLHLRCRCERKPFQSQQAPFRSLCAGVIP